MPEPTHLDESLIACYAHGVLPERDRAAVEAHLAGCADCRADVLALHRMLSTEKRRKVFRYVAAATAAAAAVLLVVAVPHGARDARTDIPVVATSTAAATGPVVTTEWLAAHAADPSVVVLYVDADQPGWKGPRYAAAHIPGARVIDFEAITFVKDSIGVELPPVDSMQSYFESRGISDATHVILTGHPLAVVRAYLTLSYLGLPHVSVLDGGTTKWRAEGRAMASGAADGSGVAPRGRITPRPDPELIAARDFVRDHIGKPGYSFVDTRTIGEYLGTTTWKGVRSEGHIAGARQIDWQEYFQNDSDFSLKPRAELEQLLAARVAPGTTVVAYCFNGGRSSSTYFVARLLGHPAKLYDGSYQDWARHREPVTRTPTPLFSD